PVTPCRLVSGVAITGGVDNQYAVRGNCGVPSTGVSAVAVNITVAQTAAQGNLIAYPSGMTRPVVSHLNYGPSQTVANDGIVTLNAAQSPDLAIYSLASATLYIDVMGYFAP